MTFLAAVWVNVLHGWLLHADRVVGATDAPSLEAFTRLTRDIYVPAGDVSFWQGSFRDPVRTASPRSRTPFATGMR